MEYRILSGSGLRVPALTFGTATFGETPHPLRSWGSADVTLASRLVSVSMEAGVNMFDTADNYSAGASEEVLGKAIAGKRDKLLISTKATFRGGQDPNAVGSSRHHLLEACHNSLRRLGTDYIDVWYMHSLDALTPTEETLRTLDDLVRAGKVRYVGCSNFSGWNVMKSLAISDRYGWPRYVANQVYYSLIGREFEWELMPLALDQRVGTVVWSALGGGQLGGKISRSTPAPKDSRVGQIGNSRSNFDREQFYKIVDTLQTIGKEIGRSVAQVAINWVLQRPSISSVVIGARTEAQLKDALQAADFKLTPEQMKMLDDASNVRPVWPYWHQTKQFSERNPPPVPQPLA